MSGTMVSDPPFPAPSTSTEEWGLSNFNEDSEHVLIENIGNNNDQPVIDVVDIVHWKTIVNMITNQWMDQISDKPRCC